jgi:chromosome segregation ATPase
VIRRAAAIITFSLALVASRAAADDLSHVSDAELNTEISARDQDIARTSARVDTLAAREGENAEAIDAARMEALEVDRALTERAGFLYRLGRRGAAFRYLVGAPSAAAFLKRYATLRRLVVVLLEARRDAGVRLTEAEAALEKTREELEMARAMLGELEETRAELNGELARRGQNKLAWR